MHGRVSLGNTHGNAYTLQAVFLYFLWTTARRLVIRGEGKLKALHEERLQAAGNEVTIKQF
jgi:hypothetical protein